MGRIHNAIRAVGRRLIARLAAALVMAGAAVSGAAAADIAIVHAGRLIAVPGEPAASEQSVIIRDGRIEAVRDGYVTPEALAPGPDDSVTVHDLSDHVVLPGLIDGHVHITSELGPGQKLGRAEKSDPDVAFDGALYARRTLEAGFTTVRDMGASGGDAVFALRDAIESGKVQGPRIFAAGTALSPTGGHGQIHGFREGILQDLKSTGICDGVADCRRAVRDQVRRGADQIKLVSTGGVLSETDAGTDQAFFDDELTAIMDTGHLLGRRVAAHAHGAAGINAALRAGVDSIEHGTYANEESFRLFKRNGAYLVPTILAGVTVSELAAPDDTFMAPPIRAKALAVGPELLEMVRRAHRAGVKIAFGTDSGVSAHGDNAREFELLVDAGLTPEEALITATVHGADNMAMSDALGTLEPGKYGDLIAVDGDPLADISVLRNVAFVMKGGVAVQP